MPEVTSDVISRPKELTVDLKRKMLACPMVRMYKTCLDQAAFPDPGSPNIRFGVKVEVVRRVIDEDKQEILKDTHNYLEDIDSVVLPAEFDGQKAACLGMQTALRTLYSSGLFGIDVLRSASRYLGVTNVKYEGEELNYSFSATKKYFEYVDELRLKDDFRQMYPYPGTKRNEFMELTIGGLGVRKNIAEWKRLFANIRLGGNQEVFLRLEMVRACAHEYGHAIKKGLDSMGRWTEVQATKLGMLKNVELLSVTAGRIHDERFARGVEEVVMDEYLRQEFGYSDEEVTRILTGWNANDQVHAEAAYAFLQYANDRGYTPDEIILIHSAMDEVVKEAYLGEDLNLWDCYLIIMYYDQPYSADELKIMSTA